MVLPIVITLFGVAAVLGIIKPRFGAILVWVFPWIYPNTLLYGTLPLNVRFDDLWLVYMFLVCLLLFRHARGVGRLTWLAIGWWLSSFLGNMTGLLMAGGADLVDIFKSATKSLYVPFTTYVLSTLLDDAKSLENHLKGIMVAGMLAGLLGIGAVYMPRVFGAFLIPRYLMGLYTVEIIEEGAEISRRAQGAVGTMALAHITMCLALMSLVMAVCQNRKSLRIFHGIAGGVLFISLAYTATRGAIGGAVAALSWAILFTRRRAMLIILVVLGLAVILAQEDLARRIMLRITGTGGETTAPFWAGLATRFRIWTTFIEHFSPVYVMFGMGMTTAAYFTRATAHSSYIGSFVYGGLFGVVIFVLLIAQAISLARRLRLAADDPFSESLANMMMMTVVAMATIGLVLETFQSALPMQIYFAMMVITEKRLLQVQVEKEAWLEAYAEQAGQLQPAV